MEDAAEGLQVAGLGRAGAALAVLLAASGSGPLALWDDRPVERRDLGVGHLAADLGRPRAYSLEQRLGRMWPQVRVFADALRRPLPLGAATIAVDVPAPADLAARARAADHPLLPVLTGPAGVRIGPWTGTGTAGCLLCLPDAADVPRPAPDAVTALRAAVLVADVLAGAHDVHGAVLVAEADGRLSRRPVHPRPGCGCGAGPAAVAAGDGTAVPADGDRAGGADGTEWDAELERLEAVLDQAGVVPWSSSMTSGP